MAHEHYIPVVREVGHVAAALVAAWGGFRLGRSQRALLARGVPVKGRSSSGSTSAPNRVSRAASVDERKATPDS